MVAVSQALLAASLSILAPAATPGPNESVGAFMHVCMGALGNSARAKELALKEGFVALDATTSQKLLREGARGEALAKGQLAIALESDGVCTVFAHSEDPAATQAALKRELPPPTTAFTVNEEAASPSPAVSSVAYHLALRTQPFADWVFSSYSKPGKYNVAITMVVRARL